MPRLAVGFFRFCLPVVLSNHLADFSLQIDHIEVGYLNELPGTPVNQPLQIVGLVTLQGDAQNWHPFVHGLHAGGNPTVTNQQFHLWVA